MNGPTQLNHITSRLDNQLMEETADLTVSSHSSVTHRSQRTVADVFEKAKKLNII